MREIRGLEAKTRGEDAIARRRGAAALDVTEHGDTGLEPGALLDVASERTTDTSEDDVPELVSLARLARDEVTLAGLVGQLVALADDHDREVLSARRVA